MHTVVLIAGCYQPPEFPLLDTVPIEAAPGSDCLDRDEFVVACTVDGDTLDLTACGEDVGTRVRMLGIDAPEISHGAEPAECGGDAAATELAELLTGERVRVTFDLSCTDVYDRTLAYVWIEGDALDDLRDEPGVTELIDVLSAGDGTESLLLNEWLLWRGLVWPFDADWVEPLIYQQRLDSALAHAMDGAEGIWTDCPEGNLVSASPLAGYVPRVRGPAEVR